MEEHGQTTWVILFISWHHTSLHRGPRTLQELSKAPAGSPTVPDFSHQRHHTSFQNINSHLDISCHNLAVDFVARKPSCNDEMDIHQAKTRKQLAWWLNTRTLRRHQGQIIIVIYVNGPWKLKPVKITQMPSRRQKEVSMKTTGLDTTLNTVKRVLQTLTLTIDKSNFTLDKVLIDKKSN